MIVLSGSMTKLNSLFTGMDKSYRAEILLGEETDTLDPSGEVIQRREIPSEEKLREVLGEFLGEQDQVPPQYSAIHVDGKRAYQRIRSGEQVEMKSRKITIHSLEWIKLEGNRLFLDVCCSKGTYIRSLARDIAKKAGSCGRLESLVRTSIGPFRLDEIDNSELHLVTFAELCQRMNGFYSHELNEDQLFAVSQGKELHKLFDRGEFPQEGFHLLLDGKQELAAVLKREGEKISYLFVVPKQWG